MRVKSSASLCFGARRRTRDSIRSNWWVMVSIFGHPRVTRVSRIYAAVAASVASGGGFGGFGGPGGSVKPGYTLGALARLG